MKVELDVVWDTLILILFTLCSVKELMANKMPLGQAYAECFTPEEDLRSFIRLCLTDQSFPGFVDKVDKELGNILS